jgi:hypothetical protein
MELNSLSIGTLVTDEGAEFDEELIFGRTPLISNHKLRLR